jgi:1-deoxyxylulose-5-phosphate synthase
MDYRRLGDSALTVSSVGLGCVTFGREISSEAAFAIMDHAVAQGMTLFDTAEAYAAGASEQIVGQWLTARQCRDRILLTTKIAGALTRGRILNSADSSLARLQTDRLDLFLLHRWDPDTPLEETLEALESLVAAGKTRAVGCCNYTAAQVEQALALQERHEWHRFTAVQSNYNLAVRDIESDLLPLCAPERVGVMTYSPLGAGFLTGKYRAGGPVPKGTRFDIIPGHQTIYFSEARFRVMEGLRAQAEALGVSMVHLALAWVFGQPGIDSVLVGARITAHLDNALAARNFSLPPAVRQALNDL